MKKSQPRAPDSQRWRFWIDRGGTFTDVIGCSPEGRISTLKLPSVAATYADPAVEAMRRLLDVDPLAEFPAERIDSIRVGATVATNALLERRGAKTLFVTTAGFADALEIGDQSRPDLFALTIQKPQPLYAGVIEAHERLDARGAVLTPLDGDALRQILVARRAEGFESVAITFLHADINPAHERAAGDIARAVGFECVALSHQVSPLPRFIPRAETTVADAYLTPPLRDYVRRLTEAVNGANLFFMTSGGGLVRGEAFSGRDAVLSGPAGGVVGLGQAAQAAGAGPVLGFDMGGTSTDVCRVAGEPHRRQSAVIAGVRIRAPILDVETVAAGGGSILAFDGLRARVGPASAGAVPGPAAYGRGGPATVTDANLVLGRLDASRFPHVFGLDGAQALDEVAARARLSDLARAMGAPDAETAARGFLAVAVEQTAGAIRRISTERGYDPREHVLAAFGGAAGQIACDLADTLGCQEILCPAFGSVLSAWGIGQACMRALRQAGLEAPMDAAGLAAAETVMARLSGEARADLERQDAVLGETRARLHIRYEDSDTALPVAPGTAQAIASAFEADHRRLFGFTSENRRLIIASVEVEALAAVEARLASSSPGAASHGFAATGSGSIPAESIGEGVEGPRLIARADTQIWVAEGWRATPGPEGLIKLKRVRPAAPSASTSEAVDPVTLELFNRRFMGVAEAMGAALERTARSVNIKERLDFSCALFDAGGALVANAPHMPVHLGSMGASVRAVRARHPVLAPGDVFALNNPYAGGTHLPDITVVMPVFLAREATPEFFVAARGHHADVGGIQPGSMPPFSRLLAEEGVLLDALPIMREGRFLETDIRAALAEGPWPCRSPERNLGDLEAQIAACQAGSEAVRGMIAAYGREQVSRYMAFVQSNAEACVRRAVGRLREGEACVAMDGGGEIRVRVLVDRATGSARLDFSGSGAQLDNNFNAPAAIVDAAALYVFRTLVDDDIPLNAGCLAPLGITVTEGSLLHPRPPAAVVAGNVETSQHVVDALYEALGIMAHSQGTMNNFTFGDESRQYYETLCGGAGATAGAAGASAVHTHMTNSRLTDPEILERRFPVRLEAFEIRRGSGGMGAQPGGDGVKRRIRFLAPLDAALLSTRRDVAPRGLAGGGDALPGAQRLISADGAVKELPGCFELRTRIGDIIEIETPGGGGFGSPPESQPKP
jgi:5-oxoprolinase (ATP-hydrolysing)